MCIPTRCICTLYIPILVEYISALSSNADFHAQYDVHAIIKYLPLPTSAYITNTNLY